MLRTDDDIELDRLEVSPSRRTIAAQRDIHLLSKSSCQTLYPGTLLPYFLKEIYWPHVPENISVVSLRTQPSSILFQLLRHVRGTPIQWCQPLQYP